MTEQSAPWPKVGPASYFPSIEKKYGRSIAEWQEIIAHCGLEKHMQIVDYLKSEYQMGHGHANALVGWTLSGNKAKVTQGMSIGRDKRVDAFVDSLPAWQKVICRQVRELIHEAEPRIKETIKRGDRPYFVFQGNVCALQTTKDHINIFIYDPIAPDPEKIINQGQGNLTARSIQVYENQTLNEGAFKSLIGAVVRNNKAGGWRQLSTAKQVS